MAFAGLQVLTVSVRREFRFLRRRRRFVTTKKSGREAITTSTLTPIDGLCLSILPLPQCYMYLAVKGQSTGTCIGKESDISPLPTGTLVTTDDGRRQRQKPYL